MNLLSYSIPVTMTRSALTALLFLGTAAFAQDVQFDYDRTANFGSYRTYQWVERPIASGDQLLDQDIKRAVDAQLAGKGLRRVDTGGDLQISYQAAISKEKQFDGFGWGGPRGFGGFDNARVTTSTIEVGELVIQIFDPGARRLVWRGSASKTLDLNKDPDKNYRTLEKAMSKLFRNYPPRGKN